MKTLTKALVGTVAASAMAVSSASPALARHSDSGIKTGEVIAGALIIGGIAAVAAAASKKDRDRYDYRYGKRGRDYDYQRVGYGRGYGYDGNPRHAVSQCVAAAEQEALSYSYSRAKVTDIRKVQDRRGGYRVEGRIAVQSHRYRDGRRYGSGWGRDYRGWHDGMRGYDSGRFKCDVRYGRVVNVDFSGIRRL